MPYPQRPEAHREAAVWHLDQARNQTILHRPEHIAAAQVEALLAIADALRALTAGR